MGIEAILCDLDGTIVDSEGVHTEAWNELIKSLGYTPPGDDWLNDCIGLPDSLARDKAISVFPDLEKYRDSIVDMKEELLRKLVTKKGRALAFEGIDELFSRLRAAGIKLAVGTNSIMLNCATSLSVSGLAKHFSAMVSIDQVERGKPEPDIYLEAARRLGVSPERCLVLEDSNAGLAAGRAAGCIVAAIENSWPADTLSSYDHVFSKTRNALEWVLDTTSNNTRKGMS